MGCMIWVQWRLFLCMLQLFNRMPSGIAHRPPVLRIHASSSVSEQ